MKYTIELPEELKCEYEFLATATGLKAEKLLVAAAKEFFEAPSDELADYQQAADELDEAFAAKRKALDRLIESLEASLK